jgi:hypothetical protein
MRRSSVRTAWVSLLHWRRPRVFSTGWWAKFCTQILRAKFIECLGCTVITWVCRGEIWQKERFSRTENLVSGFQWSRLSWVLFIIDSRSHVHGYDIICPVVCRFICEQPTKLLKYCKQWMHDEPFPKCGTCIWNQGLSKTEQGDVLDLRFFGSYFIWNEISACIIDWRRAQFEKLMAEADSSD